MVKSDGTDLYIIAVNYNRNPAETVVEVPAVRRGTAERVFGEEQARIRDGKVSLKFQPLEAKVLRVRGRD